MAESEGVGAVLVLLTVLSSILGLWILAVGALRRLSRQLDDEDIGENPFTSLAVLFEEGGIDESEYEQRRRNLLQSLPSTRTDPPADTEQAATSERAGR